MTMPPDTELADAGREGDYVRDLEPTAGETALRQRTTESDGLSEEQSGCVPRIQLRRRLHQPGTPDGWDARRRFPDLTAHLRSVDSRHLYVGGPSLG